MFIKGDLWVYMSSLRSLFRLPFSIFLHMRHCLISDPSKNAIYMTLVSELFVKRVCSKPTIQFVPSEVVMDTFKLVRGI